ncbi:MAG: hypothetical protein DRP87_15265 [Spirochaetes bacterium]|nr:MAG: hypothetical protein DRP87_15265 [Spirochaetota bacterium]
MIIFFQGLYAIMTPNFVILTKFYIWLRLCCAGLFTVEILFFLPEFLNAKKQNLPKPIAHRNTYIVTIVDCDIKYKSIKYGGAFINGNNR